MNRMLHVVVGLLLACSGLIAQAQTLDAYEGRATVEDQSPAKRDRALREALAQVLTRVSGASGISGSGRTGPILNRASALLRSIRYENDEKGQLQLVASFNPTALEDALKQAGLPVWGVLAGNLEEVELRVLGVDSPRAYARTLSALQDLPMVKYLAVTETASGVLLLRLQVEGGGGRLAGALSVMNILRRESAEPGVLIYRVSRS